MESKKQFAIILGAVFCAIVLYAMIRIFSEDDESRVRKTIYAGVLAVERQDILKCGLLLSDDYQDSYGHNKAMVLKFVSEIFKEYKSFKIHIKQLKIEIKESSAEADIAFKCYFKKWGDEKRMYYDTGKLKVHFDKEGRRWKVKKIEYTGANELLFIQSVA